LNSGSLALLRLVASAMALPLRILREHWPQWLASRPYRISMPGLTSGYFDKTESLLELATEFAQERRCND
jgi:hypothetical protein